MNIKEFIREYLSIVRVNIDYMWTDKTPEHRIIEVFIFGVPVFRKTHRYFTYEKGETLGHRR